MSPLPVRATTTLLVAGLLFGVASATNAPIPVRFNEGLVHGFLKLSTTDGSHLADGDLMQTARGSVVTSRLVFHFKDGSLQDERAVFSERQYIRLMSYHLIQKGPAFPRELEMSIDAGGQATVDYTDEHGGHKREAERIGATADLANGVILTLLKNIRPDAAPTALPMVVATPKPRVVTLKLLPSGDDAFSTGGATRKATHYVIKVDIGGLQGLVAPLVGKQPPDSHVWILQGEAPAFVKSEQVFFMGGPLWRIELASPAWPRPAAN